MAGEQEVSFPMRFEDLPSSTGRFTVDESEVWSGLPANIDDQIEEFHSSSREEWTQDDVNFLFNCILHLSHISNPSRRILNEVLFDTSHQLLENCQEDAQNCGSDGKLRAGKAMYLLVNYCIHMERCFKGISTDSSSSKKKSAKASSDSYIWSEWRHTCLNLIHKLMAGDANALFSMGVMPENFVMPFWKYSLELLGDKPQGLSGAGATEQAAKKVCADVLQLCAKHVVNGPTSGVTVFVTAVLDSASRHEHLASPLAELCRALGVGSIFVSEIMGEISRLNMHDLSKGNGSGAKNIGTFITSLAALFPETIALYLPLIMHHLDSDVYQMRCSIITSMGSTISFIQKQCQKQTELNSGNEKPSTEDNDEEDSPKFNVQQFARLRDDIIDMLIERTHDVSSYARSAVLKVWITLVESDSLPLVRFGSVAEVGLDRLSDKTATVRKSATQLLTALLESNPFSGSLNVAHFSGLREELERRIKERMALLAAEVLVEREKETVAPEATKSNEEESLFGEEAPENTDLKTMYEEDAELVAMSAELSKCISCLELLQSVHAAVPKIGSLLSSKTSSDVLEALRFFTRTVNFGVQGSASFLHKSFSLIWHQEESIRMESLMSFFQVYISDGGEGSDMSLLPSNEIAFNLIQLTTRCSVAELTSVERLIGEIFLRAKSPGSVTAAQANAFKKFRKQSLEVIEALWHIASISSRQRGNLERDEELDAKKLPLHGPLLVLKMIAAGFTSAKLSEQVFPVDKIKSLCSMALGNPKTISQPSQLHDVRTAAMCLQNVTSYMACEDAETREVLVSAAERLAVVVADKFQVFDNEASTRTWFSMCEEAVTAIFHLHPEPDTLLSHLLLSLYSSWASATSRGSTAEVVTTRLARFLFLAGQTALSQLLYTEKLASLAKTAQDLEDKTRREAEKEKQSGDEVDCMEEEMGLTAAADADHERVFTQLVEESLVTSSDSLLGTFHPFLAHIVANHEGHYSSELVREAAVLALCRYMSVSSKLCEQYLPLLFTTLQREANESIRTTIIIATGDLSFRFPNAVEPWTAWMYDRLSDECLLVRYNTLMVLTHLILNDMIKVKGQVSAVVMCLNDSSEKVCSLARLFFTELSKRSNNPVYNLLGDVISNLSRERESQDESEASEEKVQVALVREEHARNHRELLEEEFQRTMQFLLSFVTKDKQADSLLERLLMRMTASVSLKQRRNLAYCISQLPITEKGVKKMTELLRQMKDCLFDKEIVESLKLVVSKAKKTTTKASSTSDVTKEAANEFEEFVASVVNGNDEDNNENLVPLNIISGEAKKKNSKPPKNTSKKGKKKAIAKRDDFSSDDESGDLSDLSNSDDEEDEEVDAKKKNKCNVAGNKERSKPQTRGIRC